MKLTHAISTELFANALVPTKEYAMKWRERYDLAFRGSVEARLAGDRAKSASLLECASSERRSGWQSADDRRKRWIEAASELTWDWSALV